MSRSTRLKSFTCLLFCGMRFSRSGSKLMREAAAIAPAARMAATMAICLVCRRQSLASASRIRSSKARVRDNMLNMLSQEANQKSESRKQKWGRGFFLLSAFCFLLFTCARKEPLTAEKANEIIKAYMFKREPIYAEVPQRVWWSPTSPKDDFDEKSLRTLENLRRAGLVTLTSRQ